MDEFDRTGRQMKTWIAEHKAAMRQANTNNVTASHVCNSGHSIPCRETSVLELEVDKHRRRVQEALYVRSSAGTSNTNPGLALNSCWLPQAQ